VTLPDSDIRSLLDAAAAGDQRAWSSIVDKFSGLVWTVARSFRLGSADAADIHQATWLRLVEQLGRIRDPERLGAWLATTARREALALLRRAGQDLPIGDLLNLERHDTSQPAPDDEMLTRERDKSLWAAVEQLPVNCQRLLRLLMLDPPPSYHEVSAALEIPVGSIGPTRSRCLDQLRPKVTV
jgi:RNA polymerase sigma factor (sigma-70 family)